MNELMIFENEEFGKVRSVVIDGEPWLVGKDVAEILGYERTTKAIVDHVDEDDRIMFDSKTQSHFGIELGQRGGWLINESGLYSLILSSRLPKAKKFKRWVTSEVLPSIRKHGLYAEDELLDNPDLMIKIITDLKNEREKNKKLSVTVNEQKQCIESQQKEIEHKEDAIIGLVDNITLAEKRQILNRVVRHNHANYKDRWAVLYREFENKYHINLQHRLDKYNENNKPKCKSKLDYIDRVMNKVSELYEIAVKLYENDVKELVNEMYAVAVG